MNNLNLANNMTPDNTNTTDKPLYSGLRIRSMRGRTPTPSEVSTALQSATKLAPASLTTEAPAPTFSRWRALGGAVIGASVPVAVFTVSHTTELEGTFSSLILWAAVLGGLVFSAGTVYQLCCRLFSGAKGKAAAYCVLSESIMTFAPSSLLPLSLVMLAILVSVNAIQTGRVAGARTE